MREEQGDHPFLNLDLSDLAILTGIEVKSLRWMREGKVGISAEHRERILSTLGQDGLDYLDNHSSPLPRLLETRKGNIPEGYVLMRRVRASDIKVRDLISFHIPEWSNGSYWVEVESNQGLDNTKRHYVLNLGGEEQRIRRDLSLRVARPVEEP